MSVLTISGNTLEKKEWDIDNILNVESKDDAITRIIDEEWFEEFSKCGLTYGEINELDKYNN